MGVSIHPLAVVDSGAELGADVTIGPFCNVGPNVRLGDRVIMANNATLAGHIIIEDDVILGGLAAIHQFVRIGRMSILGGYTKAVKDVPPYMMADGNPLQVFGPNKVGLERHGVTEETQHALKQAYKIVFRMDLTVAKALERIEAELPPAPEIRTVVEFIRKSERGISK